MCCCLVMDFLVIVDIVVKVDLVGGKRVFVVVIKGVEDW